MRIYRSRVFAICVFKIEGTSILLCSVSQPTQWVNQIFFMALLPRSAKFMKIHLEMEC